MRRTFATIAAAVSAFFVFYTVRLLVVTSFLSQTRRGGQGAYIGAVVFPLLTIGFASIARRLWRAPATSPPGG